MPNNATPIPQVSSPTATPWSTLGYITAKKSYGRRLWDAPDAPTEEWEDIVGRVVVATQTQLDCGFTPAEMLRLESYMLQLKGTVAGRFLWQLGTKFVEEKGLASLQNCAAVKVDNIRAFTWAFDMLLLGAGVGYNIQREYVYKLPEIREGFRAPRRLDTASADFIVPDTREGWVELLDRTLKSAFRNKLSGNDDDDGGLGTYSVQLIRGKGAPIRGFGGVASGPEDLCWGIGEISRILESRRGKQLRPIDCLDIMNILGQVVVSGNIRRSAQIAIGDCDDQQFLRAKRWDLGGIPNWRSNSNNSVVCNDFKLLPEEFWEGYKGNGEAYGLINLKLSRSCGRLGETQYKDKGVAATNPCAEQSLESWESCVTGSTKIQTREGIFPIADLVGMVVEVFNGHVWSKVTPFLAKKEDTFHRISFSDGSYLDVNDDHEFQVNGHVKKKTKTPDLKVGDKLPKFCLCTGDGGDPVLDAYTLGAFCGDGFVDYKNGEPIAFLCAAESGKDILKYVDARAVYSPRKIPGHQDMYRARLNINGHIGEALRNKAAPLPEFIMRMDRDSTLKFIAGWIDTDGSVANTGKCDNYRIFGTSEAKLRDLQLLCRRAGINYAQLRVAEAAGSITNFGKRNFDLYVLTIPSFECYTIPTKLKIAKTFGTRRKVNNAYINKSTCLSYIDSAPRQRIVKIERNISTGASYCFTEPLLGMGVFNNVLTYQCCLSELMLPNITSIEELFDIATLLYRVNKHSLRLPCHHKETEDVVHRNMRMGIGVTGYLQATEEQRSWLPQVYEELRKFDVMYSAAHGWPVSIKLTTTKPSGTLSLLPGVTPGCHPAFARYLIRRIRMSSNSPLVATVKAHGYPVEFQQNLDGSDDFSTVVVSFPFSYPEGTKLAADTTAIDQLEIVKRLQTEWSDNAVSCTVYYKPEELPAIREYLAATYNKTFKSLSFLLHKNHGFKQAPLEEITKAEYDELVSKTTIITSTSASASFEGGDECEAGSCPVR